MLKFLWGRCSLKLGKQMKGHGYILKTPWKQEQTLLYQGDTFEIDSVQYLFDQDKKIKHLKDR